MNLSQLSAFRAVMNSASLSEAATKLGRTQPAVSLALRTLEDSLGLKLFERRGRQLIPVPEAHYLLSEADDILERLSTARSTLKSLSAGASGTINAASMPGPSTFLFPRFISRHVQDNPEIRVSLSSRTSLQIKELAASQNIDFGFADLVNFSAKEPNIDQEIISADCYCALHKDHPLARQDAISCRDLDGVPLASLKKEHAFHQKTAREISNAGGQPNMAIDSQYFLSLMPFISAGHCVSVTDPLTMVSELELNSTQGQVVFRPMENFFRYKYLILSPRHRPLSRLAVHIKTGWRDEVMSLLEQAGARPKLEQVNEA